MDNRTHLILTRARELFGRAHPGEPWPEPAGRSETKLLERQAKYLARAEDQLLKEGAIESVDQS
ncbi:hypothetical protein [Taklimakanibacter lacteus]|uniref:hypothetical protein n=1 Tax=Taklimakanibacter lacteus TaxID=2268456 RepID=UPI000E6676FE